MTQANGVDMKRRLWRFYVLYTLAFAMLFYVCYWRYFLTYGKAMIWRVDGLEQQYIQFCYIGEWTRNLLKGKMMMWDPCIGYGADALTSLGSSYMDPFYLFGVFFAGKTAEMGFNLSCVLRLYCAGIACSVYLRHLKLKERNIFFGTILYTFSANMMTVFKQPSFLNPYTLFPLLMICVDHLWDNEKPLLYVAVLAYCLINSYYFTYMMAIMVIIYCASRFFLGDNPDKSFKGFVALFSRFLSWSVFGALLGIGFILSNLMVLSTMQRVSIERVVPLFVNIRVFRSLVESSLIGWLTDSDAFHGLGFLPLLIVLAACFKPKENKLALTLFWVASIAMYLPPILSMMNGFAYPAWRWNFGYALVVSVLCAKNIGLLREIDNKTMVRLTLMTILAAWFILFVGFQKTVYIVVAVFFLQSSTGLLCLASRHSRKAWRATLAFLTVVSLAIPSAQQLGINGINFIVEELDAGRAYLDTRVTGGKQLVEGQDVITTRVDMHGINSPRNSSSLVRMSATDFYWGYYNQDIDTFHTDIALNTTPLNYSYQGFNGDSVLSHLMGVRYLMGIRGIRALIPYGYDEVAKIGYSGTNVLHLLYESDYEESLFTTFDKTYSLADFLAKKPYERREIINQAVVLEDVDSDEVDCSFVEIPYELTYRDDVVFKELEDDNEVKQIADICFDPVEDAEIYLYFDNLDYANDPLFSTYRIVCISFNGDRMMETTSAIVNGMSKKSTMYGGKHTWLVNLGKLDQPCDRICMFFNRHLEHTWDDLKVFAKPRQKCEEMIEQLRHDARNVEYGDNRLACDMALDKDAYVLVSLPYSRGWTCYDNGEKVEILKADEAFMALRLQAGEHHIEMRYTTPWMKEGMAFGLAMACVWVILFIKRGGL